MSVAMLGTRMSAWPVIYDIEHGVQHGTNLILPNGTTVQTDKAAPDGGSAYAIQHPNSVAATLSPALLSKGYTSTAYDLVSGEGAVFLGDNAYENVYWFYMADDGVLCGVRINNGVFTYAPVGDFTRGRTEFPQSTITINPAPVAADIYGQKPTFIFDVKNNGAEVILAAAIGSLAYSTGDLRALYHIKLSGPSTAVVMSADSATIMYGRYPNPETYPENWYHSTYSETEVLAEGSTAEKYGVLSATAAATCDRISGARFKADGTVELIHLYTSDSMSSSGSYVLQEAFPGSSYSAFVGSGSMSSTLVCELRAGSDVLDTFTLSSTANSTTTWISDGQVLQTIEHTVATHSWLGTVQDVTTTTNIIKEEIGTGSSGYPAGSNLGGDAPGYAYCYIPYVRPSGGFFVYYYMSAQRVTNKIYSLGFNGTFYPSTYSSSFCTFLRAVRGVYGIGGVKYEPNGGITAMKTAVPTPEEYAAGGYTTSHPTLAATQHPVTLELRCYGEIMPGQGVDTDYCFV